MMAGNIDLRPVDVARFAAIARREAGIQIAPARGDFLAARLGRLVSELGFDSFGDYVAYLESQSDQAGIQRFVEAIVTHTTEFFRERRQYDWLAEEGIPMLHDRGAGRDRDLVVWSAACSSGQELYSAMLLADDLSARRLQGLRFRGVGTDISQAVVSRARAGFYREEDITQIPDRLRTRGLLRSRTDESLIRIRPELRQKTDWKQANLCHSQDLEGISADVAMLRNVLIYFDEHARQHVLRNVIARLRPGGILVTGHAESIDASCYGLRPLRTSVYLREV